MAERSWNPAEIRAWKQILRDMIAYALAAFLILLGSLRAEALGVNLVATFFGTALVLLGLPSMLRIDRARDDE